MHRRNVPVLAVTVAVMMLARLMWDRLLPTHYADLGATEAQIATIFSVLAAMLAVFQLVGGWLADRVGRKPVAVLPIFGVVIAVAWMAQAVRWQGFLVGHLAFAIFASMQAPGFTSLLAESVPAEARGRAFGTVTVGSRIASVLGLVLGAWLLTFTTLPILLWGTVLAGIIVSLVRLCLLRETLGKTGRPLPLRQVLREVDRGEVIQCLIVGTLYAAFFNLLLWGPFVALHAHQVLGLDNVRIDLLFAAGDGVAILTAPLLGGLGDRIGYRRTLAAAVLFASAGFLAWALLPAGWGGTLCFVVAMTAGYTATIVFRAFLTGIVEGRQRGMFIGLMGTLTGLLASPASHFGAWLRSWGGSSASFWAALGLAGMMGLVLVLGRMRKQARQIVQGSI